MNTKITNTSTTPSTPATPEELQFLARTVLEGQGAWFDALSPEELEQGQAVIDRARALMVENDTQNDLVWDWLWDAAVDLG